MVNSNSISDLIAIGFIGIFAIGLLKMLADGFQPDKSDEEEMQKLKREGLVRKEKGKWKLTRKGRKAMEEYDD